MLNLTDSLAERLRQRDCWIFDMDGTLTIANHDFEAIRAELDLPPDRPILEALAELLLTTPQPKPSRDGKNFIRSSGKSPKLLKHNLVRENC